MSDKRATGLAAMALALVSAPTPAAPAATTIDPPEGALPYQEWVAEAKVPTPDVTLTLIETPCPPEISRDPANACTKRGTFTIWMDPENGTRERFYHELGHNFDYYELRLFAQRRFAAIIGDARPWRTKPGEIGLSPHEIFAEAYAQCARRRRIQRAIIQLPPIRIGPRQHHRICELIDDSAGL